MPRSKLRRKVVGRVGSTLIRVFERWAGRKSALQAERAGARLGRLFFRLSKKHRNRALSNLKMCFPELSDADRQTLAVRSFEHFGIVTMDFLRTAARTDDEILDNMELEGAQHMLDAIALEKGVVLVTAHFGNWERLAAFSNLRGYPIYAVARDADNARVQADVLRLREKAGLKIISRGSAARALLQLLREKKIVGLLPDQNSSEIFVPFFGKPTGTVLGPATLSVRTGAPMVPGYCVRIGPGKYKTIVFPPLEPEEGIENKIEGLTRSMNNMLEDVIREYPEQWLWLHDRWKSARQKGML